MDLWPIICWGGEGFAVSVSTLSSQGRVFSMSDPSAPTLLQPTIGLRAGNRALSVMDQIREAILGGSIGAGERLNEVRLSKTLTVSRTPVRAALQALAGGGLVGYTPNHR